jgi:hypothetical protein
MFGYDILLTEVVACIHLEINLTSWNVILEVEPGNDM